MSWWLDLPGHDLAGVPMLFLWWSLTSFHVLE